MVVARDGNGCLVQGFKRCPIAKLPRVDNGPENNVVADDPLELGEAHLLKDGVQLLERFVVRGEDGDIPGCVDLFNEACRVEGTKKCRHVRVGILCCGLEAFWDSQHRVNDLDKPVIEWDVLLNHCATSGKARCQDHVARGTLGDDDRLAAGDIQIEPCFGNQVLAPNNGVCVDCSLEDVVLEGGSDPSFAEPRPRSAGSVEGLVAWCKYLGRRSCQRGGLEEHEREGGTDSHTIRPVHRHVGKNLGMCLERGRCQRLTPLCVAHSPELTRISQRKVLEPVRFLKTSSRLTALTPVGRRARSDTRASSAEERWNMVLVATQDD